MPTRVVSADVSSRPGTGARQDIAVDGHRLVADSSSAPDPAGPTPVEMLVAALGACSGITIRGFADRQGIPLETVEVRVSLVRGEDDAGAPLRPRFVQDITLTGPLTDAQRRQLLRKAGECTVHKLLAGDLDFEEKLAETVALSAQQ